MALIRSVTQAVVRVADGPCWVEEDGTELETSQRHILWHHLKWSEHGHDVDILDHIGARTTLVQYVGIQWQRTLALVPRLSTPKILPDQTPSNSTHKNSVSGLPWGSLRQVTEVKSPADAPPKHLGDPGPVVPVILKSIIWMQEYYGEAGTLTFTTPEPMADAGDVGLVSWCVMPCGFCANFRSLLHQFGWWQHRSSDHLLLPHPRPNWSWKAARKMKGTDMTKSCGASNRIDIERGPWRSDTLRKGGICYGEPSQLSFHVSCNFHLLFYQSQARQPTRRLDQQGDVWVIFCWWALGSKFHIPISCLSSEASDAHRPAHLVPGAGMPCCVGACYFQELLTWKRTAILRPGLSDVRTYDVFLWTCWAEWRACWVTWDYWLASSIDVAGDPSKHPTIEGHLGPRGGNGRQWNHPGRDDEPSRLWPSLLRDVDQWCWWLPTTKWLLPWTALYGCGWSWAGGTCRLPWVLHWVQTHPSLEGWM